MNKLYALIFALAIAGLVFSEFFVFTSFSAKESTRENAVISKVTDGDTLKLSDGRIIRLLNINSPEKKMPGADLAADYLRNLINKSIQIEITGTDKYDRNLARIYAPGYVNLEIVKNGLASKFLVQESELADFSEAEESAIRASLGIWKKSSSFGCFDFEIDKIRESVLIENSCEKTSISGWMLKDESRKTYYFSNISFGKLTLHSGKGNDNSTDIFWGESTDIWNNDRDSLYLFEPDGGIAGYETYGY